MPWHVNPLIVERLCCSTLDFKEPECTICGGDSALHVYLIPRGESSRHFDTPSRCCACEIDAFALFLTYMGPYPAANAIIQGEALAPNTATNPCSAELDVLQHAERMKMQVRPSMRADLPYRYMVGTEHHGRPSLAPLNVHPWHINNGHINALRPHERAHGVPSESEGPSLPSNCRRPPALLPLLVLRTLFRPPSPPPLPPPLPP